MLPVVVHCPLWTNKWEMGTSILKQNKIGGLISSCVELPARTNRLLVSLTFYGGEGILLGTIFSVICVERRVFDSHTRFSFVLLARHGSLRIS
jgi:hypothetical protein